MRLLLAALAALALSLALAACGGDDEEEGGGEGAALELTIGDLVPLTGQLSPFGPAGQKAADLANDQIQAAIEDSGVEHTVEVVHEDTQTDPQAAPQAARQAIGEGASCVAGAWASGSTIPVAESVTIREEVLQISPASTSPEITDLDDNGLVFRTAPADTFQGELLADVVEEETGGTGTVNIGARNDSYGTGLAEQFTEAWEAKGGTVGETVIYDTEQPSYNSEANQLVSGNPDAFLHVDFPEPFDQVGAALVRTGEWDASRAFGSDGLAFPNLADIVGTRVVDGLRASAPGSADNTAAEAFEELFAEAGGAELAPFDAQNFDAIILCYLAAVAAGSAEGPDLAQALPDVANAPGTEYTFEELSSAIEALQNGEDINYEGPSGSIEFDENGDPTTGFFGVFQYSEDTFEQVNQVPFGGEEAEAGGE